MPRFNYQSHFVDGNGSIVTGGNATIYLTGTTTVATIYENESGGSAVANGQLTTDSGDGSFSFFVDTADYDLTQEFRIVLSKSGYSSQTYDNIKIYPYDVDAVDYTSLKGFAAPTDGTMKTVYYRSSVGDGGGGQFSWKQTSSLNADDLAAIAVDTGEGVYVPDDGANGYWVRQHGQALVGVGQINPAWFGATGAADDSAVFQLAINYASEVGMTLMQTQAHTLNVTIGGPIKWEGNNNGLVPAADNPVITIDAGSNRTILDNIAMVLNSVNRAWTNADGIRLVGQGGSEDYTTIRSLLVRGAPGYGIYAYGNSTAGGTVQRLHVYDSTLVDSEYANARIEGVVLECQFQGCFFNNGCKLGATPAFTDSGTHDGANNASALTDSTQSWTTDALVGATVKNITDGSSATITANTATTVTATLSGGTDDDWDTNDEWQILDQLNHSASPAREFRRGSVELLRWYTATDTATNDLTPNRINFVGCNWANNEDNTGTDRTAGLYISGGVSTTVLGSNFENPFPAIWFAKEDGTISNYKTSSRGALISNCTFKIASNDVNVNNHIIEWDGHTQVVIDNPNIQGDGSPTVKSFFRNNMQYAYAGLARLRNVQTTGVTYTNGIVYRESSAYSPTRLIANARYMAHVAGVDGLVVGKDSAGHTLDALTSIWNSLNVAQFHDDMEINLSADPAINGNLTVTHDADDGAAGVLAGKFALAGSVDATLDATWKKIRLQWDAENQIWIEIYRNF